MKVQKTNLQTTTINHLHSKATRLDRSVYKLDNGNQLFFRTSKAHKSGNRLLFWFGFHKDRIKEEINKLFVLFVCDSAEQVLVIPATMLLDFLSDVPTATDDNWKIRIFKDNGQFDMHVTGIPGINVTQYLNKFDLVEEREVPEKTNHIVPESIDEDEKVQISIQEEIMNLDGIGGNSLHDKLIDMMRQVGEWMEYKSVPEYKLRPDVPYVLDVAWIKNDAIHIAIEVQISGNITEAKDRLILAKKFGARKCVIVSSPDKVDRIKSVFRYDSDIKHWIEIWGLERIYNMFVDGRSFFENYAEFNTHQYRDEIIEIV